MPSPQQIDFDPRVDYYKALGLDENVTSDDIKRVYRKLARQFHPDSTGGDKAKESRFKEVQAAYDVLGDPRKRRLYDDIRAQGFHPGGFESFDLGDLFGEFFRSVPRGTERGHVHVAQAEFDDDTADAEFESRVQASDGSWLQAVGNDVYSDVRISFDRAILGTVATVPTVDGNADVKIPPGTSSGKKLRLRGKGIGAHRSYGQIGDHYVIVQIDVPATIDEETRRLLRKIGKHA